MRSYNSWHRRATLPAADERMISMRKYFFGVWLALGLLLFAHPAAFSAESNGIGVHFAPKPAGDPDGVDTHIVNFFNKAQKTLHGCFYELREQKFIDALIAAEKRGVDVKLLTDNTSFFLKKED